MAVGGVDVRTPGTVRRDHRARPVLPSQACCIVQIGRVGISVPECDGRGCVEIDAMEVGCVDWIPAVDAEQGAVGRAEERCPRGPKAGLVDVDPRRCSGGHVIGSWTLRRLSDDRPSRARLGDEDDASRRGPGRCSHPVRYHSLALEPVQQPPAFRVVADNAAESNPRTQPGKGDGGSSRRSADGGHELRCKYTFVVDPQANKTEIKIAVEQIFSVKVASVNTINRKGKTRRTRFGLGKRKDTKRAIVTLREGTIDIFG